MIVRPSKSANVDIVTYVYFKAAYGTDILNAIANSQDTGAEYEFIVRQKI